MIRFALALLGLSAGAADAQELARDVRDSAPAYDLVMEAACAASDPSPETELCAASEDAAQVNAKAVYVNAVKADRVQNEAGQSDGIGSSAPSSPTQLLKIALASNRLGVLRGLAPAEGGAGADSAAGVSGLALCTDAPSGDMKIALHPFAKDTFFVGTLNGADPSALFCP